MDSKIIKKIAYKELDIIKCLQNWQEVLARKYSDENNLLFVSNPDLCKTESTLYISHLFNRFAVFWNNSEFDDCKEIIAQLNKMPLTGYILIQKLQNAAELEYMLANYPKALSLIEEALHLEPTDDEKYKLLLLKGKIEHEIIGIPFRINSFSEALGIAEKLENSEYIAEIYCEMYTMFYSRYPGLAVYFARKAEVIYANNKNVHSLTVVRLNLALTLQSIYDRFGADNTECFKKNADFIVKSIDESTLVMPSRFAFYNRVKGIILKDEGSIEKAFDYYYNSSKNESEISRTLQMMLDVFIHTQNHGKVKEYMPLFKKHFSIELYEELDDIESRLSRNLPANRFQEFDNRKPEDPFTLLDVLDRIAIEEEWCFENQSHISDYNQEGKFEIKKMADKKISLIPCGLSHNNYYRGERGYHAECKPSLYRKNMTPAKQFVERVKYEELCILIEKYPLVQYYRNGIDYKLPDGTIRRHELSVDKMALAQHYGICTELIDFTVDKFVAAFFACTKYNYENDTYSINDEEGGDGCFYHYKDKNATSGMPQKLRAVGLQPFSRPGEQAGYVLSMNTNENLNDLVVEAIHFKHNGKVSEFIFNYTNRSKKLFPKSILDEKAMIIKNSKVFSRKAYEMAKNDFYPNESDDVLMGYMRNEHKSLCDAPIVTFSSKEIDNFHNDWKRNGANDFLKKLS
ncbi:MAG: FRG domain-containing protein [Bacteroidaceae bacterium]|nr:FRG domain-containing protein [Bacteroidaceae bacterium]